MYSLLADTTTTSSTGSIDAYGQILLQAGAVAGILYWLTKSLIPKLQEELSNSRKEFSLLLENQRTDFLDIISKERDVTEKHRDAISSLIGSVETLSRNLTEHKNWNFEAIRALKDSIDKGIIK